MEKLESAACDVVINPSTTLLSVYEVSLRWKEDKGVKLRG